MGNDTETQEITKPLKTSYLSSQIHSEGLLESHNPLFPKP